MKADGSPANRDPVFLQETGLVPTAGRLMAPGAGRTLNKVPSFGYVRPPGGCSTDTAASSGLTSSSMDPAVPITMYTEAAAKSTYTGSFYVSRVVRQVPPVAATDRTQHVACCSQWVCPVSMLTAWLALVTTTHHQPAARRPFSRSQGLLVRQLPSWCCLILSCTCIVDSSVQQYNGQLLGLSHWRLWVG